MKIAATVGHVAYSVLLQCVHEYLKTVAARWAFAVETIEGIQRILLDVSVAGGTSAAGGVSGDLDRLSNTGI